MFIDFIIGLFLFSEKPLKIYTIGVETVQWLRALAIPAEHLYAVPNTYLAAHNHLFLQFQKIQ